MSNLHQKIFEDLILVICTIKNINFSIFHIPNVWVYCLSTSLFLLGAIILLAIKICWHNASNKKSEELVSLYNNLPTSNNSENNWDYVFQNGEHPERPESSVGGAYSTEKEFEYIPFESDRSTRNSTLTRANSLRNNA